MDAVFEILASIMAVFGMSLFCAMNVRKREFSTNVFLASCAIGVAVLVWIPLVPIYSIVVSILCIAGIYFMGGDESE